uniref:Tyrosine-protein kinase receptor n=1 Tax=Rhodnius prolixus TaxID=13249 RepID=T1H974_RHOPR
MLGHFLYLLSKYAGGPNELHVWSPKYVRTGEMCKLSLWLHMSNMTKGKFRVVIDAMNHTQWVASEQPGNDDNTWKNYTFSVGPITQEFNIILEVVPSNVYPSHIALDNIKLKNCFPDPPQNVCMPSQFQCSDNVCIDASRVCNINKDCANSEDEHQDCFKVQAFARCTFEEGWCGWHNRLGNVLNWTLNNGSTATSSTGPSYDHTYQNATGMYVYVDMSGKQVDMGTASVLESPIINPPPRYHSNSSSPYHNSCFITFYYHKYGPHSGSLGLFLVELQRITNISTKLWWSYGDKGNKWLRQVITLPNITNQYYLQFEARKGYSSRGDTAIDDISISPKCFGIGVPAEHLNGYDYQSGFQTFEPVPSPVTHVDFVNSTYYLFTPCGSTGRHGPTQENCLAAYNNTDTNVTVLTEKLLAGIQKWTVPEEGYYTIIAKGASGGKGSDNHGTSWGAMVRTVVELRKGQNLYILVGQEGNSACIKNFASYNRRTVCQQKPNNTNSREPTKRPKSKVHEVSKLTFLSEGGGGGGATFVFTMQRNKEKKPVVVAAGGGGLGHGSSDSINIHHGHGINKTLAPTTGNAHQPADISVPAGAGGGWRSGNYTFRDTTGLALQQGAIGGKACYISSDGSHKGAGGFGGGGGGCTSGGGGGGYTGGRAWSQKAGVGEGGYSWIEIGILQEAWVSRRRGPGEVYIIPAIYGCGCDYLCVALDTFRSKVECLCPEGWHLAEDHLQCIPNPTTSSGLLTKVLIGVVGMLVITVLFLCTFLYNRYQRKKDAKMRRMILSGPDLQLDRLRVASDSMMTEYNPNYEFGGGVYSLRDLKEIPREHLQLVKALGQGAFGEVYQGFFKNRAGDAVEMPVAVKTLPELSTSQAETDFLMEALIMSKFNHPNIVHFIGVCFDKHPRFIVIELLAGGDLKTFLRESRPKPDRAAPLTMRDLLSCIVDVAKGCKYMEENRFIHRDIAARNCLLTTKGPGRVVKIADFGMARDIYRADYYRKGGKAMLPIKWMPPEAFLDGIFTTKTDVWSFGVLMWEVMSMGYMPYTGCANREVMQLVTNGGRLAPPTNCPSQLYAIMTQCWQPNPDDRPGFALILERLGYCLQDPDVIKAPLPVYTKPPSSERDTTIMRPTALEDCLQPDYLVPLPGPNNFQQTTTATNLLDTQQHMIGNSTSIIGGGLPGQILTAESRTGHQQQQPSLLLDTDSPTAAALSSSLFQPQQQQPPPSQQLNNNSSLLQQTNINNNIANSMVVAPATNKPLLLNANATHLHHHHHHHHRTDQPIYIISSNVKQDTEISC